MADRRGVTLVELLMAVVTTLIVTGAVHNLLLSTLRAGREQANRVSLQANVRAASLVVVNELRELSTVAGGTADQNDILSIAPGAIMYRAARGIGFLCQASSGNELRIGRADFTGHRDPQAVRDAAYFFVEGGADTGSADGWLPVAITGVSTSSSCPGVAGPGLTLTLSATPAPGLTTGTPVRIYEIMELRIYQTGGSSWLGARSVSAGEVIQPIAGPLTDATGFRLEYLNGLGLPTTDLTSIKSIKVAVRGTVEPGSGPGLEEELRTQVTLRNAFLP